MSIFKLGVSQGLRNSRAAPQILLVFVGVIFITVSVNLWFGTPVALMLSGQFTALFLVFSMPFWSLKLRRSTARWWIFAIFVASSTLYFFAIGISAVIGTVDVPAVLYHVQTGIVGFESAYVTSAKWIVAATWLAFIFTSYMGFIGSRYGPAFTLAMSALLLGFNPFAQYSFSYLAYQTGLTKPADALNLADISEPTGLLASPPVKKNLVIVYLEGLDRTYGSDPVFKGSYDEFSALAEEGLSFSDIDEIANTSWSIGGMTATQCGVPIFRHGAFAGNGVQDLDYFMPKLTCLGDLLSAAGYRQTFIVGADVRFAGMDNFYRGHGRFETIGMNTMDRTEINTTAWVFDSEIFRVARSKLVKMNDSGQPYNLIVKTVAPHGPFGWISEECRAPGQTGKSEDILPAVACLGRETRDFVTFIRETADMDNTVIVLVSDHLGHRNNMTATLNTFERRNTAIILGKGIEPQVIDKRGSMVDIAPTILELMGYILPERQFNLGVSLLSDRPTNLEAYGMEALNQAILYDWKYAESLWAE